MYTLVHVSKTTVPDLIDDIAAPEKKSTAIKAKPLVIAFKDKPRPAPTDPLAKKPEPVTIARFMDLLDEAAEVAADIKECTDTLKAAGEVELIAANCRKMPGTDVISSVLLVDNLKPGTDVGSDTLAVRITGACTYPGLKKEAITEFCAGAAKRGVSLNPNDVVRYEPVATFNGDVFNDVNGKYSAERFAAFQAALNAVCEQYGVPNPLTVEKQLVIQPDWHGKRWHALSQVENVKFSDAIPNTIKIEPVRPKRSKVDKRAGKP